MRTRASTDFSQTHIKWQMVNGKHLHRAQVQVWQMTNDEHLHRTQVQV